jgi:hypothetical protein
MVGPRERVKQLRNGLGTMAAQAGTGQSIPPMKQRVVR